jgi:hypothetical protein
MCAVVGCALSRPDPRLRSAAEIHVRPRNELERRLAATWDRVLVAKSIGVTDNFFDVAGDSLPAIRLVAETESAFAKALPPGAIFSAPTIEQLARVLDCDGGDHRLEGWGKSNAGAAAGFDVAVLRQQMRSLRQKIEAFQQRGGAITRVEARVETALKSISGPELEKGV